MPSANTRKRKKPMTQARRKKAKRKKQRRGPVMRFRFSQLVLLWIMSLIFCFGAYLYNRNFHPEKDVFIEAAESEPLSSGAEESAVVPDVVDTPADTPADTPQDENSEDEQTPLTPTTTKINPVPESAPQPPDYLRQCAFLGETNIYQLGQHGLLEPFSVYASDKLNLSNYTREYVLLNGTTIRILSAVNSASCPIYLMFGTESLSVLSADETANQFDQLLNSVIATAPESTVYVLSIPPVTEFAETNGETPILNSVIDDYNTRLLDISNRRDVYFVDVNTALKNNEGKLDPRLAEEDGIHLTAEAGQLLLNYVLNHVPPV